MPSTPRTQSGTDAIATVAMCLDGVNKLFSPPFDASTGSELVNYIKQEINCEAVSIFISKHEPNRLDYVAGTGYHAHYADVKYYLGDADKFLTAHVFKSRRSINQPRAKIPLLSSGDLYVESSRDGETNVLAVPILAGPDRCYGVLKLENKPEELSKNGAFPDSDFDFATQLAYIMGIAYQQRLYGKLAVDYDIPVYDPARKTLASQLEAIAALIKQQIRAECVSIFVRRHSAESEDIVVYEAGTGYVEGYQGQYRWSDESFTIHVAQNKRPLRFTVEELVALKKTDPHFPYTGRCISWIRSGSFRNILGIPILNGESSIGVLKLENKLPEHEMFNECDERVCDTFAQGPIRNLLTRSGKLPVPQGASKGYRLLIETLGTPPINCTERIVEEVRSLQRKEPEITGGDCAAYLRVSRATYYRKFARR